MMDGRKGRGCAYYLLKEVLAESLGKKNRGDIMMPVRWKNSNKLVR